MAERSAETNDSAPIPPVRLNCLLLLISRGELAICDPNKCRYADTDFVVDTNSELLQLGDGDRLEGWKILQEENPERAKDVRYAISGEKFSRCNPSFEKDNSTRSPLDFSRFKTIGNVHPSPYDNK